LFTPEQIQQIEKIITLHHVVFIGNNIGTEILSDYDKYVLDKHGIDVNKLSKEYTNLEQAYHFGKLSTILQSKDVKKLTYNDFLQYLRRGQYEPLTEREKGTLRFLKRNTYNYIKGLEASVIKDTNGIIINDSQKIRDKYEQAIKDSVKRAVIQRDSIKSVVLELGNKFGDWQRNLNRIAATEMQNAYEWGRAEELKKVYGTDVEVYKDVYPGACRYCIQLFLTNGIGSQPKIFKLQELIANGNNYNSKPENWKPVLGVVHPFCRCSLNSLPQGMTWNKEETKWQYQR